MEFDHLKHKKIFVETLSSQMDLAPEPCDNIDPRHTINNQMKFAKDRLEDILNGEGSENAEDVLLTKE